ncbi:MAG: diadenylate cyclase [bacterium]
MGAPFGIAEGLLGPLPWIHAIDVGIMWFLLYQVYVRIRGTQAMRLLLRVFAAWLGHLAAQAAGLTLTSFLLWALWIALLIFFLIHSQAEIQRVLRRLNPMRPFGLLLRLARGVRLADESLAALAGSVFALARKEIGAIVVLERRDSIEPLLRSPGEVIDAEIRPALLETIFSPGTPYHDGAIYIQDGRVHRVGCVLPLSEAENLPPDYGTRHRAALGITESSDALAVVVSEERGEVSTVEDGRIKSVETADALSAWLTARLQARRGEEAPGRKEAFLKEAVLGDWRAKLAVLAAVLALWSLGMRQREDPRDFFRRFGAGAEERFSVPVVFYNLPAGLALGGERTRRAEVRLRGRRDILNFLDAARLRVAVNLAGARAGLHERAVTARDIDLPAGMRLLEVRPAEVRVRLRAKKQREGNSPAPESEK